MSTRPEYPGWQRSKDMLGLYYYRMDNMCSVNKGDEGWVVWRYGQRKDAPFATAEAAMVHANLIFGVPTEGGES